MTSVDARPRASAIEFTPTGAQITGVPSLTEWAAAYDTALSLGAASTWGRTDLLGFAEDEQPYGDDWAQYVPASRVSEGTLRNDRRRWRRYPPAHALRQLIPELGVSHFDAAAPLSDTDAETVLTAAATEARGREWVRAEVKRIQNLPTAQTFTLTLCVDADGGLTSTVAPPTWTHGLTFEITLRERVAA